MPDCSRALREALRRADLLVDGDMLRYFVQLYDPRTGGFYYSISSRDTPGFTPFAEGTRFVLESVADGGITSLPDWYREKLSAWLLSHQDPADGYFYEELWGKIPSGPRRDRDLTYSLDLLVHYCGRQPLYPTPQQRMQAGGEEADWPVYLRSRRDMLDWLDSLDWTTPQIWHTGQKLASAISLIAAAGLDGVVREYVRARQNGRTGLWADDLTWLNINGAMKLSSYFCDPRHPYPYMDRMIESIVYIFQHAGAEIHATYLWNPFMALKNALASQGERAEEYRTLLCRNGPEMVRLAVDRALQLRRADGGFSSDWDHAQCRQQGYLYGLGLKEESDMDGTVIAGPRLRRTLYEVFGAQVSHDYFQPMAEWFWEALAGR